MAQRSLVEEARAMGRRGGVKRMLLMTPQERRAFAKLGSDTRWGKIPQKEQKAS